MLVLFEPGWVDAADVVLCQPLDLLKQLDAVHIEAARKLVRLVGQPDRFCQVVQTLLILQLAGALQIGHLEQCPALARYRTQVKVQYNDIRHASMCWLCRPADTLLLGSHFKSTLNAERA